MSSAGEKGDNGVVLLRALVLGVIVATLWKLDLIVTSFCRRDPRVLKLAFCEGCGILFLAVALHAYNFWMDRRGRRALIGKQAGRIYLGRIKATGEDLYIGDEIRCKHIQLLGPTGEGKTSRAILPWTCADIEEGSGLLFVDGKGDGQLLGQIYGKVKQCKREADFHLFSLSHPELSSTFNPLIGQDSRQVTERVFSALTFSDPFYRALQYESFHTVVSTLMSAGVPVLPGVVRELLRDKECLRPWQDYMSDGSVLRDLKLLLEVPKDEYAKNHAGVVSQLGKFCQGGIAPAFNSSTPEISLEECIEKRKIVYFQLPTMRYPELAAATGKLVLQCMESAVASIQDRGVSPPERLFSVYLDDFNDFLYPEFVLLLNKSRSANVGVVFSHQSMGDLGKLGPDTQRIFWDNTRTKIIMRLQDPETCEQIAKYFGTKISEASTARRTQSALGPQYTGEESVRLTQEFHFHPDQIKSLKQGQALVGLPNSEHGYQVSLGPPPILRVDASIPRRTHATVNFLRLAEASQSAAGAEGNTGKMAQDRDGKGAASASRAEEQTTTLGDDQKTKCESLLEV